MPALRTRPLTLAPSLALALLGLAAAPPQAARAQGVTITVTDITPAGHMGCIAEGVSGGAVVGQGQYPDDYHALLFTTGAGGPAVDLNPAGFDRSDAAALSGGIQAGSGEGPATVYYTHALLWAGTAASAVDLNPSGFLSSQINAIAPGTGGVSGSIEAGSGLPSGNYSDYYHALLWHGTAASAVDLNPPGFINSGVLGVSGATEFGVGTDAGNAGHALMWRGTAASVSEIAPPAGFTSVRAYGLSGAALFGSGSGPSTGGDGHALLWTPGVAGSAVDLNPAGYVDSAVTSASGGLQVGYAYSASDNNNKHAFLWRGTAASAVDLGALLPAGYRDVPDLALGIGASIDADGDIAGYGNGSAGTHAFLWHVSSGVSVSGAVSLQGVQAGDRAQPITFTFTPTGATAGGVITQIVTPDANTGTFTLSGVPAGTYTLGVKGGKWLRRDVPLDTTGGPVSGLSVSLLGGDVGGHNQVSLADLAALRAAYGSHGPSASGPASPGWNPQADLTCDGQVSLADLAILRANYGRMGDR